MTLEELAEELGITPGYLYKHWTKVKRYNETRGIIIEKLGRGKESNYGIKTEWDYEMRFENLAEH